MDIVDLISGQYRVISIIGMAKNAGKTVALNELIDQCMFGDIPIALTSIGRDGERQDIVTCTEKPMIYVNEGTLIATAESLISCSEVNLEIIEVTDFNTPIGKIVIARAVNSGYVQVAGPSRTSEVKALCDQLLSFGAKIAIVDGALDRVSSASPAITEATILSTGAVLSRDMNKVVNQTLHQIQLLQIKEITHEAIRGIAKEAMRKKQIAIVDSKLNVEFLSLKTALNAGKIIAKKIKKDHWVVFPGSLVTKTLLDIVSNTKNYKNLKCVVGDATKIFIDYRNWMYFNKIGIDFEVVDPINLLAVTINPYAPQGYFFDPDKFKKAMTDSIESIPVIDVMNSEVE